MSSTEPFSELEEPDKIDPLLDDPSLDDPLLDDPSLDDPGVDSPDEDDPYRLIPVPADEADLLILPPSPPALPSAQPLVPEPTTPLAAPPAPDESPLPPSSGFVRLLLILLILGYAAYFSWATINRYAAFESRALDMGNLNQAIWNTAHGDWFHQTNQPGSTNRLSLHVEPILLPISALYWIHDGPETLLVLQAIIVALGALPVFGLARRQRLPGGVALLLAAAWLLMPAMQSANWLEFHPVTLAPTLFLAAFYFLVRRRVGWYAFFALLAALCKEDLGLTVAMLGVYAIIMQRMWATGLLSITLGAGWAFFAVFWVQKQFGDNIHWARYGWLGDSPGGMVRALVSQPGLVWQQLQSANVWDYLFRLLLPVGFLAVLAPEVLLIALPSLAINLLADFAPMHQVDGLIYAAPIAPWVMAAAVMGMGRLWRWTRRNRPAGDRTMGGVMWLATLLLLGGSLLAQWWWGYLPGMGNDRVYTVTSHHRAAQSVLAQLTNDDRLSSQDKLNPHVSGRTTSYIFPDETGISGTGDFSPALNDPNRPATAANSWLIDATGPAWPLHPADVHERVEELLAQGATIAAAEDGYLLLRAPQDLTSPQPSPEGEGEMLSEREDDALPSPSGEGPGVRLDLPDTFYTAWRNPATTPAVALNARFGDELELLGYTLSEDGNGNTNLELYWRPLRDLETDYSWLIRYVDSLGNTVFDSLFYQPPAALWYPSSEWQPNETVLVTALPWALEDDHLEILLGAFSDGGETNRLPIADVAPARPTLDGDTLLHLGTFSRVDEWRGQSWQQVEPYVEMPALLDARFGEALALEAAHIRAYDPANQAVLVQMQWRLDGEPPQTWNLVLQLFDSAGNRVAQLDTQPHIGAVDTPLATLDADSLIVGSYAVPLPKALLPGEYTLAVGVRDWNASEAVTVEGANLMGDGLVALGTVEVTDSGTGNKQ